jgi:hypothetical protein
MEDRVSSIENRRGGGPQRIGEILAELMVQYQRRFLTTSIVVVQTPTVMEDQSCSFYPAELVSVS